MTKRLALALTTRDRVHLSERAIEPLIHEDIDLWVMDGSKTLQGRMWAETTGNLFGTSPHLRSNVTGGADAAIVYALTTLLNETESPYVGICENDLLLHRGWVGPTLATFARGESEGLAVGAVSARCYTDRILCQRDGYALCHNLGAGHIILTREAAACVLKFYRSHWTTGNVKVFHQLSGLDIRKWWCFRGHQHMITVDWGINSILAAHGLASLALTPSCCEMIGQDPPLHEQGLTLVTEPVEMLRNDKAFETFAERTACVRMGKLRLPDQMFCHLDDGSTLVFPHQLGALGHNEHGDWRFKWQQGFGPFAYVADPQPEQPPPTFEVPIAGPCTFMVSGGKTGGRVELVDTASGYEIATDLSPEGPTGQITNLAVSGSVAYRTVRLTALSPGINFYGIQVSEPQPTDPTWTFDHSVLPKP